MRLFYMKSGQARMLLAEVGVALAVSALIAGCGNNYRPVVTPITPSGPAPQVTSYVVVVSTTGPSTPGVATIIDYAGDSIMAQAPIGIGPNAFTIDELGSEGYTVNADGTLTNFPITTSLQAKYVTQSTLPFSAQPVNMMAPSSGLWAADLTDNVVDVFSGSPQTFKLAIPLGTSTAPSTLPVSVFGPPTLTGQREYVLSQNVPDTTGAMECNSAPRSAPLGAANPIEIASNTADPPIPVGKCPVYAVQSPDLQRFFVLNRGDDTITVINSQNNALDACTPYQNQNGVWVTCHPTIQLPAGSGPIYGEYNSATQQLVVANYDGGTISVIDVSLDQYGNDSNTYANSSCSTGTYASCGAITGGFGTTYTIPVGNTATPNPASVTVLADGSKAYTANQNDTAPGDPNGTVTVVNLSTHQVEKTLTVVGHPRTVVSTQNSEYSKVYVASPDSPYVTVISSTPTVTDEVDTNILVEGDVVDLRVTTQNGTPGNANFTSRVPGYGQPCNLPGATYTATLAACREIQ
jgi:DNA-binding beta-propeller fold protein YncE